MASINLDDGLLESNNYTSDYMVGEYLYQPEGLFYILQTQ